jgi:glycogen synthase
MSKLRILYVASEINPFLQTSEVADFVRKLPQAMQEKGMEIRILVPRFGIINERKKTISIASQFSMIRKTAFMLIMTSVLFSFVKARLKQFANWDGLPMLCIATTGLPASFRYT